MATIGEILFKLGLDASGFVSGVGQAKGAAGGLQSSLESVSKAGRLIATVGAGLTAGVTVPLVALGVKSVMAAAQVDSLDIVVRTLGENAGYSAEEVDKHVASVEKMGIEAAAAREIISKFIIAQLDASKASDIARIAQDQAVISGLNSTEVTEQLTDALLTGNVLRFRTLKMNVDLDKSYQELAKTLGKNVDELSEAEKVQARFNAVQEYGATVAGTYEAAMADSFKQMGSFKRLINEILVALGGYLTPALHDAVFAVAGWLKEIKKAISEGGKFEDFLRGLGETIQVFVRIGIKIIDFFMKLPSGVQKSVLGLVAFLAVLGPILVGIGGLMVALPGLVTALTMLGGTLGTVILAIAPWAIAIGVVVAALTAMYIETEKTRVALEALSTTAVDSKASFADYQQSVIDTYNAEKEWWQFTAHSIDAQGRLRDALGGVIKVFQGLTEAEYEALEAHKELVDGMAASDAHLIRMAKGMKDIATETELATEAHDTLAQSLSDSLSVYEKVTVSSKNYRDASEELQKKMKEVWDRIQELQASPYLTDTEQQELVDLRAEYDELKGAIQNLEVEHDLAMRKMIASMAFQRLAAEGWTRENMELYLEIERGLGLMDEKSFEVAQSVVGDMDDMLTGVQVVEEGVYNMLEAIRSGDGLATKSTHVHLIYTLYEGIDFTDVAGGWYVDASGNPSRRARGGSIIAGRPYLVGEEGPEVIVPNANGEVIPNDQLGGATNNYYLNANYPMQSELDLIQQLKVLEVMS